MAYSDLIYENETTSVLPLKGKVKEAGTYECRWKNSKGEPRHRNFTVNSRNQVFTVNFPFKKDETDTYIIIISVSLIGLLAAGIKVYLDKVKDFF
jgi:hypothetical protein